MVICYGFPSMIFAHDFPTPNSVAALAHSRVQNARRPDVRIPMVAFRIVADLNLVRSRTFQTVLRGSFNYLSRSTSKTFRRHRFTVANGTRFSRKARTPWRPQTN
uniref:Uncharacterized protein n=1 Tax=Cacopsylla melanoneura TaxID=428564 RepID=A0A8D8T1G2_9HEMI